MINKKFYLGLTILGLTILLFLGLNAIFLASKEKKRPVQRPATSVVVPPLSQENTDKINQEASLACSKKLVGNDPTVPDCAMGVDNFYKEKATQELNISVCNLIENLLERTDCLDRAYIAMAMAKTNPADCLSVSQASQKIACTDQINYYLASNHKDQAKQYCDQINTLELKNSCLKSFISK